ncbi:MAG: DUF2953 domain-containing protein [Bacteroides sp.]|nr:DUF2953 domain-containing protein [Bacteroides sp.]
MTAIIIISAAALLIFFLLASFVKAELEYDGVFKFRIKYLCFTIVKNPLSPRELKKKKRREEKSKLKKEKKERREKAKRGRSSENKTISESKGSPVCEKKTQTAEAKKIGGTSPSAAQTSVGSKTSGSENADKPKMTPELIFRVIGKAKPHVKRIFKKIRISGVCLDITTGGEDAAKAAISYGVHCAAVNGLAAFLENAVSFKAERIDIRTDFQLEKNKYYGRAKIKLRLSTLLHSGIWGALAVIGELKEASDISEEKKENKKSPQKAA